MEPTPINQPGAKHNVIVAAAVGAIAGFAFSPIPLLFDAAWLSWLIVPAFAAAGALAAVMLPAAHVAPARRPNGEGITVNVSKLKWPLVGLLFALAALILGRDLGLF